MVLENGAIHYQMRNFLTFFSDISSVDNFNVILWLERSISHDI